MTVGQGTAPNAQIAQFRADGVTAATGLRIPFFTDAFARAFGMPDTHLVNMLSEETPLREERPYVAMVGIRELQYSRPGLVSAFNQGSGPIRGLFAAPPQLGGFMIVVSGQLAYNVATGANLGSIPGQDLARFATSRTQMVLVAAGVAYLWNGSTFAAISNGTLPAVSDVVFASGRFVYTAVGTDTFWYSEINDAANETGLDFATAELLPDGNVGVAQLNDNIVFFGASSVEFWAPNAASADAPFTPVEGQNYQRGCASRDTIVFADNALFWVGDDTVVYRSGSAPSRVSSSSIESKIRQCANPAGMSAFVATFDGHELYVLTAPGVGTYAYDISRIGTTAQAYGASYGRGLWAEWQSWNQPVFRGRKALQAGTVVYVGDNATNDIWSMQVGVYSDAGGPMTRQASAFIKIEEGTPRCTNIVLHCVRGVGNPVDPGSAPVAEMRYSDDLGRTFGPWRSSPLGAAGVYGGRAFWQRLGLLRAPGRLVEIRVSDPVNAVFSHLELNASRPAY